MPKRKRLSIFRIIIELVILYLFSGLMFSLGYITGIFYLVTITLALFSGILFTRKNISWMIIFGTILSYFAGKFVIRTLGSALAGDSAKWTAYHELDRRLAAMYF